LDAVALGTDVQHIKQEACSKGKLKDSSLVGEAWLDWSYWQKCHALGWSQRFIPTAFL